MPRIILSLAIGVILAFPAWGQPRPMTTDDTLNMVNVGDVQMTPDGRHVFFSKSELDWSENKREKTYYLVPADGGEAWQFIGKEGGSGFRFSPDGSRLAFLRTVDKKRQLFVMRMTGGEAVQMSKHETSIGRFLWNPNSSEILFTSDESREKEVEAEHKKGDDVIFVDEGPNGQSEAQWQNLWRLDLASKEEERLTEDEFRISDLDISPDGSRAALIVRYENRRNQRNLSEIFVLDLKTRQKTRLTENRVPESRLKWAPDGESLSYMAPSSQEWELRHNKIWLLDLASGKSRLLSASFEGDIRGYEWDPQGQSIYFGGMARTDRNLFRLDVKSGSVSALSHVQGTIGGVSFSKDCSRVAYVFSDADTPPDVFSTSTSEFRPSQLTRANPWIEEEIALARPQLLRWKSQDGLDIEGLFYLPADYREGNKIPLILHIHGGPAGVFSNSFGARYHVWAGLGYASLAPNVRGSRGYGDDLLRGNMRDIGGGDYEDLMTGVDHVIKLGYVDPDRMGVRGWSYGGILGGWTIGQTDRFKAASVGAMVSDWTSEYGPGFNHDVRLWYIGGTPWENPADYRAKSALTHVASITTPTLIIHGMRDTTDTEPQSMMFFTALKDQGKTTRYIRFPREPHGFREPRHQRRRDVEEIRWMQQYVLELDWKPWERKKEDDNKDTAPEKVTSGK